MSKNEQEPNLGSYEEVDLEALQEDPILSQSSTHQRQSSGMKQQVSQNNVSTVAFDRVNYAGPASQSLIQMSSKTQKAVDRSRISMRAAQVPQSANKSVTQTPAAPQEPPKPEKEFIPMPMCLIVQVVGKVAGCVSAAACVIQYSIRLGIFGQIFSNQQMPFYQFQVWGISVVNLLFALLVGFSAAVPPNSKLKVWQAKNMAPFTSPIFVGVVMLYACVCQASPCIFKAQSCGSSSSLQLKINVEAGFFIVNVCCIALLIVFAFFRVGQEHNAREYYAKKQKKVQEPYAIVL